MKRKFICRFMYICVCVCGVMLAKITPPIYIHLIPTIGNTNSHTHTLAHSPNVRTIILLKKNDNNNGVMCCGNACC